MKVTGTLNSTPNQTYRVEFFVSPTGDPLGFGQGKRFLGFQEVTTDADGNATIGVTLPAGGVVAGEALSATATDPNGNTSEFSRWGAVKATPQSLPPGPQITARAVFLNGMSRVIVRDAATRKLRAVLTPFVGFRGVLNLRLRDLNGDRSADLIVWAVINGKVVRKVYDGRTLHRLA